MKIFLIDDNQVLVDALCLALSRLANITVVGSAKPGDSGIEYLLRAGDPDIVTVDVGAVADELMPFAATVVGAAPRAKLMALTGRQDRELAVRAATAGFDGWVSKTSLMETFTTAMFAVRHDGAWFPPAQVTAIIQQFRANAKTSIDGSAHGFDKNGIPCRAYS
ncbi:response regulator [Saccharomonospora sp. NPDC046836]|uniref:response regulator n=1 Tax=Saccharomonospora sp. NPDC046836 TaxID=3156921 RepID=UPI00340C5268